MTEHHFETHEPVALYVEIGSGSIDVTATDTTESRVEITGRTPTRWRSTFEGRDLRIVAPRRRTGFFSGDSSLVRHRHHARPAATSPVRTGSADLGVIGDDRHQPRQVRLRRRPGRHPVRPQHHRDRLRRRRDRGGPERAPGQVRLGRRHRASRRGGDRGVDRLRRRRDRRQRGPGRRQDRLRRRPGRRGRQRRVADHRQRRPADRHRPPGQVRSPREPPATSTSASRPAPPSGPTSPPCRAGSTPTSRAPASPARAPTTSSCGRPRSAATSSSPSS